MTAAKTVQEALCAVMEDVRAVGKDGHNSQQNYSFRGIDAVVNAAGPAFRRHGIVPLPRVTAMHRENVEVGRNRTLMALVTVQVTYRFVGPAGDYLEAEDVPGEAMDSGDKAVAKAMSVAYRIALLQTLAIPTDDPDPDGQSFERAPAREVPPPATEEQRKVIEQLSAELDDEGRAALNAWWKERGLRKASLTEAEADEVIVQLGGS